VRINETAKGTYPTSSFIPAMPNRNCLLSQKLYHYLKTGPHTE